MAFAGDAKVGFFEAVEEGDVERVDEMLREKRATVEDRCAAEGGCTALHRAAQRGHLRLARLLVEQHGADVDAADGDGRVPLEDAVDNYRARLAKYLIGRHSSKAEYAADLLNPPAVEALVEAVEDGDVERVRRLLDSGAVHVDCRDNGSYRGTPLHVAARHGREELVRLLVDEYRADINITDDLGDRPVDVAAMQPHTAIADFLLEKEKRTESTE